VADALQASVLALLPDCLTLAVDLFCGVGFFSRALAERAARLVAVEASLPACGDFAVNLDAFDMVELFEGSTDQVLPALKLTGGVYLADPPRAGMGIKTLEALAAARPSALIYISCDPATLARDAARLARHGYSCRFVQPFDMFPHTQHIECLALFEPEP
jgi:tRNA/tmRNA/rRNA uracil-C5-methylase (TrmA/RlmC/RlmD family)